MAIYNVNGVHVTLTCSVNVKLGCAWSSCTWISAEEWSLGWWKEWSCIKLKASLKIFVLTSFWHSIIWALTLCIVFGGVKQTCIYFNQNKRIKMSLTIPWTLKTLMQSIFNISIDCSTLKLSLFVQLSHHNHLMALCVHNKML